MKRLGFMLLCLGVFACTQQSQQPRSRQPASSPAGAALGQMEIAFVGNPPQREIKAKLDEALRLYGMPITEENYSRAGSVLVTMRKNYGPSEMQILDYMIRSYTPGMKDRMSFPDAAAISATFLALGDK